MPSGFGSRAWRGMRPELEQAARAVIGSGRFVLGEQVAAFEAEYAAYCGVEHCVGVANGTEALELGLKALGIGPGHHVATVANAGMYATVAILAVGATPSYVDVDALTLLIDPAALADRVDRERPDALIVTHLYGRLNDMERVLAICAHRDIPVIEDCAQAHGAARGGRKAGAFGDIGCFSFYPTKNLGALGDGGAVVSRSNGSMAGINDGERLRRVLRNASIIAMSFARRSTPMRMWRTCSLFAARSVTRSQRRYVPAVSQPTCTTRSPTTGSRRSPVLSPICHRFPSPTVPAM